MTQFLLIRHGSTDMLGVAISGWLPGVGLTQAGRDEVSALAQQFIGIRIHALYTSPLERTRRTAGILAHSFGLEPIVCPELGELRFGQWTGKSFEELRPDPHWQRFNTFRSGTRIPEGELMLDTQLRVVSFMLTLRDRHRDQTVALVTHGDVIKGALTYFLGMPLDLHPRLEISPASVSHIELTDDSVQVLRVNATPA